MAFWTDGTRYAVWQTQKGSALVVYDTLTGHRGEVMLPAGCTLGSEGSATGRFLLRCTGDERLLDLRSGVITTLPPPIDPSDAGWRTVGSRYVEGFADKRACQQSSSEIARRRPCIALLDQATGTVTYRPESQVGDLDRPGAPPVCSRLRKKVIGLLEEKGEGQYNDGLWVELVHVGEATPNRIRISRCHGHSTIVHTLTGRNFPENLDLGGGILTWDSGQPGTGYFDGENLGEDVEHGVLWSYDLSRGQRERWTLPRTRLAGPELPEGSRLAVLGSSTHTEHVVFWLATRTLECFKTCEISTFSVYMARMR